jgi:hypothetical protein
MMVCNWLGRASVLSLAKLLYDTKTPSKRVVTEPCTSARITHAAKQRTLMVNKGGTLSQVGGGGGNRALTYKL